MAIVEGEAASHGSAAANDDDGGSAGGEVEAFGTARAPSHGHTGDSTPCAAAAAAASGVSRLGNGERK